MRIGIVADNYKLDRFKQELSAKGFTEIQIYPFTEGVSQMHVIADKKDFDQINKICQEVELFYKRGN